MQTTVTVEGLRTVVDVAGRADAETVVFVHGNPGPSDDWEPVVAAITDDFRTITMDLPPFGRADRPERFDYSIAGYGRFLAALLGAIDLGPRMHLVAHDFGGAWATAWLASARVPIASLTLIATPVVPTFRWHRFARIWQTPLVGEVFQLGATRALIKAVMQRANPRPLPSEFLERVAGYADLAQKLRVLPMYRATRDPRTSFAATAETLRALDPPACVIWGADDPYANPAFVDDTCALFSRCERHLVARAGHWPFIDEPSRVAAIVRAFLLRHRAQ